MHICYPGFRTTGEKYLEVWDSFRDSAGHYNDMTRAQWEYIGIAAYGTEGQFWVVLTYAYD